MLKNTKRSALIMAVCMLVSIVMTVCASVPAEAASNPVANGWYMIVSGNSGDRVLDINNWSQDNGGNLEIYQKNNTTNQRFFLQYLDNGYYSIMASHSGKYLHKRGSDDNVHQWDGYSNANAQWALEPAGNGYYYLINRASGKYLDNNGGRTDLANNVGIYKRNESAAQKWKFLPIDGWYVIESGNSSERVLDINNWSQDNGGNLEIYQKNFTSNQAFYLKTLGNGYYSLMALHSGKYLHKRGSDDNVHQWEGDSNSNAQWALEFAGGGYFQLRNRANGKYLDNNGGRTDLANNVGIYERNGSAAQKWNFIPVNVGNNTTTYYVSTRGAVLNVRREANDSASLLGSIATGTQVDVYDINYSSDFAKVNYNGQTGYVHSEYLFPRKPEKVFDQRDYWQRPQYNYGYASNEDERNGNHATIASGGCGIVSITNAAYYLTGNEISPPTLAEFALTTSFNKYEKYRYNGGTHEGLVRALCDAKGQDYGIKWVADIQYDSSSANTVAKAKSYLQNGNVAVVHVKGHFIALVDYDARTDKYLILDSYPAPDNRGTGTGYRWLKASDFTGYLAVRSGYENKNIQIFGKR